MLITNIYKSIEIGNLPMFNNPNQNVLEDVPREKAKEFIDWNLKHPSWMNRAFLDEACLIWSKICQRYGVDPKIPIRKY
jgi:hypothetical protein